MPVAVGADRRAAIERLLAMEPSVDVVVLDDGFQHRRVARDLDLVLVDAARPALDGALLPVGWLREPASGLRRAHAVVVTRAEAVEPELASAITRHHGRAPIAWSRHVWDGLQVSHAGVDSSHGLAWLRGRRVAVWAGIGNPKAFIDDAVRHGATVVDAPDLADHARHSPRDVARLADRCRRAGVEHVLCTGKDWVKLRALPGLPALHYARPRLQIGIVDGAEALRQLLLESLARGDSRVAR